MNSNTASFATDEELVRKSLQEEGYFAEIVKRYEKPLARYVRRIMPSMRDSVDDILQEVFLKTYMHLKDFDPNMKFSSWIYRITHNHIVSALRKEQSRPKTVSLDMEMRGIFDYADECTEHEDAKYAKEEVEQVLKTLPKNYREILSLLFIEEKRYREISQDLRKPVGTVGVLVQRAKKKFKENYMQRREMERKNKIEYGVSK
jgi:RNA polymerase sigma-70 factor (ECF subfamily)